MPKIERLTHWSHVAPLLRIHCSWVLQVARTGLKMHWWWWHDGMMVMMMVIIIIIIIIISIINIIIIVFCSLLLSIIIIVMIIVYVHYYFMMMMMMMLMMMVVVVVLVVVLVDYYDRKVRWEFTMLWLNDGDDEWLCLKWQVSSMRHIISADRFQILDHILWIISLQGVVPKR